MSTTVKAPKPLLFTDPNQEAIRAVDQITFHRSASSHLDITCCAHVVSAVDENNVVTQSIVTARLRMDLTMAQALLDGLTKQIAMTEAAQSPVN